jgi:hypothetical protein
MPSPSFAGIIDVLPQLLSIAQILVFFVLSWIFGSFAFRGMKKRIPLAAKIAAKLGVGFLCVLAGAAMRKFMFFFDGTIFQMLQLDLFVGGLIGAALVGLAFYMITRGETEGERKTIKKLEERVRLLEGVLLGQKTPTLKEGEARKTAESLLPGFSAEQAGLKDADWEILLEKGGRKAVVTLGAYTGEVKKIERGGRLRDPYVIAGAAIIVAVVIFSVLNFSGFPSVTEGVASMLGMSDEQFKSLTGGGPLPEGCVATVRILMKQGVSVVGGENTYSDDMLKGIIEAATGRSVMLMYKTDYEGSGYIISITIPKGMEASNVSNDEMMKNAEICSSTSDTFCDCIKIPEMGGMTTGFIIARR